MSSSGYWVVFVGPPFSAYLRSIYPRKSIKRVSRGFQEGFAIVTDFQTAVENDKEILSHYVNRRGENPTENTPWGTFS